MEGENISQLKPREKWNGDLVQWNGRELPSIHHVPPKGVNIQSSSTVSVNNINYDNYNDDDGDNNNNNNNKRICKCNRTKPLSATETNQV